MLVRRVIGSSMLPCLSAGDIVIARTRAPRVGDVVIARQNGQEVIKRVRSITDSGYDLRGDNSAASSDSRVYGLAHKNDILAVMILKFPAATAPPQPKRAYAPWLGAFAALIMIAFALIHLFRIDTFLPLIQSSTGLNVTSAYLVGTLIPVAEVFAVPFLLRMYLSPLMRAISAVLVIVIPITWLLFTIARYVSGSSIAQFGEFYMIESNVISISLNTMWLSLNVFTVFILGSIAKRKSD